MYGNTLRSLVLLFFLPSLAIGGNFSIVSDTIPPEITTLPTDLTLSCGVPYQQQFDSWIDDHGGLAVSDAGTVEYFNTFQEDLDQAIQNSSDTLCGTTAIIPIGFYAIDDCNNVSDTAFANFIIEDSAQPLIVTGASPAIIQCDEGVIDSLQTWLDNIGGAVANEVCDGEFTWSTYIWNDNIGNSGFANVGDTTNIEIIRSNCDWSVDVTFFVLDDCGNANATTSKFSLIDTVPPLILNLLTDTIIACVDTIPNLIPNFVDRCDGPLEVETEIESTQGDDPNECGFYNYSVISSFQAIDICGNENMADQVVQVVDTLAPIIIAVQNITIDCDADLSLIGTFIDSVIDCAPVQTSFTDSLVASTPCSNNFIRTWNFIDVCGNSTEYLQDIIIIDQLGPSIEETIPALEIQCSENASMNETLSTFLSNLRNLEIADNCGTGNLYINNAGDPEKISFEFQFTPEFSCNGSPILFQESIPITLVDDCGNFEQAVSSLRVVDTIQPVILNCPSQLSFQLETGECEIDIPLTIFNADLNCDSIESVYYFTKEILLDSIDNDSGDINFNWTFTPGDSTKVLPGSSIQFSTQGILNENLGLDLEVRGSNGELVFEYSEILSFCDNQSLDFIIDDFLAKNWVEAGIVNFNLNYKITEFFECTEEIKIGFKVVIPTLVTSPLKYYYTLDLEDGELQFTENDSITLASGRHEILYIIEDCGGQRDSCIQNIEVIDLELPELNCPTNFTLLIPDEDCEISYQLNPAFDFIQNCTNNYNFQSTMPLANDRFLKFTEQDNGDLIADNIQLNFENINLENIILNPVLIVELLANTTDENGFFSIRDENGEIIGETPQGDMPCLSPQLITIDLTLDQLITWNTDGSIDFNFIDTEIANGGITPCSPDDFDGQIDMSSFLSATLAFTEVIPQIVVTDEVSHDTLKIEEGEILFTPGFYNVALSTSDSSGNFASCNYQITVEDNTAPIIDCQNTNIEIGILDQAIIPDESHIDFSFMDNCDSVSIFIDVSPISCDDIGSIITANIFVTDQYGNSSNCFFDFDVLGKELEPSFSSSLCGGDTLSLMNNVSGAGPLTYNWTGPNNFASAASNPKIDNVSAINSGLYQLEVETLNGCRFSGSVEVLIEALDIPEIESATDIVCEGEELILSSNNFSDNVLYIWYEGIAPNGNAIGMTTLPMIVLNPNVGDHRYYCIVDGNGCQSEPSNIFEIEVIENPIAIVTENFITACEGESFSLSTDNINPSLEFMWTGPDGYISNDANPEEIENININQQGTYQLVVTDRGCISAPTSLEVIIFSKPDKPIVVGENVLCEGSDFSLTVSNNASADKYTWYLNGQLYNTTNTNSLIILSAQEQIAGDWTVVIEDDNCTSESSDIFILEIESQITIGANNNGPICEGGTVTLMASFIPDAQYSWTTPNDQVFIGRVVDVPAVNGIYTVEVITAAGCEGNANTMVEIIQVPEITALSNSSQNCMGVGDDITFSPSIFPPGNYDYHWFGPNNFNSNEVNPTAIYQGVISNGTYSLQIRNGNCLSELSFTEVNSTLTPPQPVITQDGALCLGDPINILASNVSADVQEYIWNTPIGQIVNQEPALSISPSSNINIGSYSLTVVVNGCTSPESETINIALENEIPTPSISGPVELCANQELNLTAINPNSSYTYQWLAPDGTNYQGSTLNIDNFTPSDEGNYFLQAQLNGCVSAFSSPFSVNLISGPPTPTLSIQEFRFCEDNLNDITIEDFINSPIAGEFIIRDNNNEVVANSTTGNFNNIDLSGFNPGFYTFSLYQLMAGCESAAPALFNIIIDTIPASASFVETIFTSCDLGFVQLEINNPAGIDLQFEINGDNVIVQNQTQNQVILNVIDFGIAEVLLSSIHPTCGLFATESLTIDAIDEIIANDDDFVILGLNNTLVSILENDQYNSTAIVNINNIVGGPILDIVGEMVSINTNNIEGDFEINYTICSEACPDICDDATISLSITATDPGSDACIPYNLITPNADGQNDLFEIPCSDINDVIELKIFNSFGSLIYESPSYQGDWSGTSGGEDVPVGTYYYFIKINQNSPMAGFLVVER